MARPQPTQICSHSDNNLIIEVCEADAIYAVLYQGRPVKIRKHNPEKRYQGMKYNKTAFPEPGHAVALARRLNAAYETTDFSVGVMNPGKIIDIT